MTTNNQTSIASLAKKRRTYSAEFKQQIVQACKAPDAYPKRGNHLVVTIFKESKSRLMK